MHSSFGFVLVVFCGRMVLCDFLYCEFSVGGLCLLAWILRFTDMWLVCLYRCFWLNCCFLCFDLFSCAFNALCLWLYLIVIQVTIIWFVCY